MNGTRILVFAYSQVGHACLETLLKTGHRPVCVYTHDDGAGENIWFPSVRALAARHGIPVRVSTDLGSEQNAIEQLSPHLILSFYYRDLIPASILALASLGAYNMHGSLLPRYRGRAPVNWAVLNGETETGATLHVMTAKADAGDIVDQKSVPIGPDDTSAQVQARVSAAAVAVLERQIEALAAGRAPRRPQIETDATYFGRRRPEDGRIDWARPALGIHNLVRAVTRPFPGAFGPLAGGTVRIWATRITPVQGGTHESPVFDGGHPVVRCGDGRSIEILDMQQESEEKKK